MCLAMLAALSYLGQQIFGDVLAKRVVFFVARFFGVTEDHMIAAASPYVIPGAIAGLLLFFMYRLSHWRLRRTVFTEDPTAFPYTLQQMSVTKIAEYLANESVWGWNTYARLNIKHFVKDLVPDEMRRAGVEGQVRFIGTEPNQATSVPIDMAYWRVAVFDQVRIWDSRNTAFTEIRNRSTVGIVIYENGTAPQIDVLKTWPRASRFRRAFARSFVAAKRRWYSMAGAWSALTYKIKGRHHDHHR